MDLNFGITLVTIIIYYYCVSRISNGVIADVFTVFAQTPLGENQENKITAFIVERNFEGVSK